MTDPDDDPHRSYRQRLFDDGLLVASGVDGVYGRSAAFERVVAGVAGIVEGMGRDLEASVLRFPPVLSRATLVQTDYLRSFPSLTGDVVAFSGDDQAHRSLLGRLEEGRGWSDLLAPTGVVLCPAACQPLYPTLPATVATRGCYYDVCGWVFRHEPSVDPARLMSFRQYELVYVGTAAGARDHRDRSLERAFDLAVDLGLEVSSTVASDPFFGRAGRILASNQRAEALKYEVLTPTSPAPVPTAIVSANCHEDHFGRAFGLRTAGGETAHTACIGFGLERMTLALVWRHGPDPDRWSAKVRHRLWA